jgi:glycosyltransferase involved in cell wall biosynthesis
MLAANAMSAPPPLLSVIVVCKNPGPRLMATLESVWAQRWVQPEVIVIDGGSTDGTVAWLERHRAQLTALVSEPDHGLYEAMNKGVALARGEWVLFLGADDRLHGDMILSDVAESLTTTQAGIVVGEAAFDDGRIYRLGPRVRPLARNFIHHQASFYRRSLFGETGPFDVSLRIMGDYDFNLRLWKSHVRFKSVPLRVTDCAPRGLSDSGRWQVYREEITVRHRYAAAWRCWPWDAGSVVRWLRKRTVIALTPSPGR